MNFYIQQSIHINFIKIGGVSNSSILHIGSAGIIKPQANLYNTGGFTGPAPEAVSPNGTQPPSLEQQLVVPLQSPGRTSPIRS